MVCTDVAARGLDIPNVQNVVHYQCPFNAEIYVHRSGRTARIGRQGQSLNLLASEDQVNFKTICKVLKKSTEDVQMLDVKYSQLDNLRPLIESSSQLEKSTHQDKKREKSAQWLMKTADEADLDLDDDLVTEI
jgi:ATP-dependent RNA helicase DDX24/MAK5